MRIVDPDMDLDHGKHHDRLRMLNTSWSYVDKKGYMHFDNYYVCEECKQQFWFETFKRLDSHFPRPMKNAANSGKT